VVSSAIVLAIRVPIVSSTPSPRNATASSSGTPRWFSAIPSCSTEEISGRSRLLYWKTSGSVSGSRPIAFRFSHIST
jgi:hypothetical protein